MKLLNTFAENIQSLIFFFYENFKKILMNKKKYNFNFYFILKKHKDFISYCIKKIKINNG